MKELEELLEDKYPFIFGELDDEQKMLPKSLLLIENATDIVNILKNTHGFLEDVFEHIISENESKYSFLGSYTIDYMMKPEYADYKKFPELFISESYTYTKAKDLGETSRKSRKYDIAIQKIKDAKKDVKGDMVLHIGARLEAGGHYGIIIKKGKNVIVFDSMQVFTEDGKYVSGSSAFFIQVAKEVFGKSYKYKVFSRKTVVDPEISSVQITGGFIWDPSDKIEIQNMDSQNHFCYMWAVWFFHMFILAGEKWINQAMDLMMADEGQPHPLIFIKKYTWGIINVIYPTDKKLEDAIKKAVVEVLEDNISKRKQFLLVKGDDGKTYRLSHKDFVFLRKFYQYHFRFVWGDLDYKNKFKVCEVVPYKTDFESPNEALIWSV
jgi:hypothetical protein